MKKLNKLQINSEKLMKNEELVTLRGGYGCDYYPCFPGDCCFCYLTYSLPQAIISYATHQNCDQLCRQQDPYWYGIWECII
ncbi:MAG TPA: hypothetical protein PK816_12855 [Candidatus Cloacimonadota bacterium]|nr:hypothetical protein [Candidatus Cloacimonadota bacterium]